ncbi:MAG: nucleotidyl transferase AbiEii/AbiGii toxin family protein [Candidatus Omnitrophota bacterium]
MKQTLTLINKIIKSLNGKVEGFYLAGGTALSLFYFHHRESYDLDFFTKDFSKKKAEQIVKYIAESINITPVLSSQKNVPDQARMLRYLVPTDKKTNDIDDDNSLKLDFVEDVYKLIKDIDVINGIPVLSKEDIYLRKIYAACGINQEITETGKKIFKGGRQDAKDFFDLYHLSKTFMPLSKFVIEYCNTAEKESVITWYRRYNRTDIKLGLNDIKTDKKIDFHEMEQHFRSEIENLIREEME